MIVKIIIAILHYTKRKNETFEILIEPQAESVNSCLAILKSYCEDTLANSSIYFVGNGSEIYKDEIKSTFSEAEFFLMSLIF